MEYQWGIKAMAIRITLLKTIIVCKGYLNTSHGLPA